MPPKSEPKPELEVNAGVGLAISQEPAPLSLKEALTSDSPEARLVVSRDAWARQQTNKPPVPEKTFQVTFRSHGTATFKAKDRGDAWAKYCDKIQEWPSPRLPGIEIVEVAS